MGEAPAVAPSRARRGGDFLYRQPLDGYSGDAPPGSGDEPAAAGGSESDETPAGWDSPIAAAGSTGVEAGLGSPLAAVDAEDRSRILPPSLEALRVGSLPSEAAPGEQGADVSTSEHAAATSSEFSAMGTIPTIAPTVANSEETESDSNGER